MATRERGNPWSGVRLPRGPGLGKAECFKCTEDRRVLRLYGAVPLFSPKGAVVGGMLLCDGCAATLLPLNPDPLDVTTLA